MATRTTTPCLRDDGFPAEIARRHGVAEITNGVGKSGFQLGAQR